MVSSTFSKALLAAAVGTASATTVCTYTWQAGAGDTCASMADLWAITVDQFQSYNPSAKCSSPLISGVNYCVEWDFGSGAGPDPVTPTTTPGTTTTSVTSITPKPTTTTTPKTFTTTTTTPKTTTTTGPALPSPTQDGLISTCKSFYKVAAGDTCEVIVSKYNTFSIADFYSWNPAVGTDCSSLWGGYYVCVGLPSTPTAPVTTKATTTTKPATTTAPTGPSPTQTGITSKCTTFYMVASGDTCASIQTKYSAFTLADFYSWNPAVGTDCSALWGGYYVCVGVPGTPTKPTTTAKPTTTTAPAGPSPTQTGITSKCTTFYKVASGDTCASIQTKYSAFTLADFYSWNPAVGTDCSALWGGYYVCVGVPGTPTKPTTTAKPTTTTAAPSGPTPTQTGITTACNAWYQAKSGDVCQKVVDQYKTFTLADFYSWNKAVGTDCAGLWVGYWYCVGVKK